MDAALKAKIMSAGSRPDPVTTEIVRNGLIAATGSNAGLRSRPVMALRRLTISAFSAGAE